MKHVQSQLDKYVIVKLEAGETDYFIACNRTIGIHAEVQEHGDCHVILTNQNESGHSWIDATLDGDGQSFLYPNIAYSSKDITMTMEEINLSSGPAYVHVRMDVKKTIFTQAPSKSKKNKESQMTLCESSISLICILLPPVLLSLD